MGPVVIVNMAETLESDTSAREMIDFDSFSDRIDEESGTEDESNDEEAQDIIEPYRFEPSGTSSGEDDGDDMDDGEDIDRLQNTEWLAVTVLSLSIGK
ncbi:hypothetical protein CesoFtcFv8_010579 [Champsocephalus esox]|uniref:Uncharacterized protein n=1 Tax=Champsocephalus esox TaxID=159716 RepID=A0AAN8C993_9TELE|nr:hypothetical protein CesoFtcFv8_010579 [Champsocephalus esox]